ncbi:hypothetical protein L9F63_016809, partial [Diploptera punctata]
SQEILDLKIRNIYRKFKTMHDIITVGFLGCMTIFMAGVLIRVYWCSGRNGRIYGWCRDSCLVDLVFRAEWPWCSGLNGLDTEMYCALVTWTNEQLQNFVDDVGIVQKSVDELLCNFCTKTSAASSNCKNHCNPNLELEYRRVKHWYILILTD